MQERTVELERANKHLTEQSRIMESFFKDTITPLVLLDRDFNIGKHARATQVRITLSREQNQLKLVIRDNGVGI